MYYSDYNRPPEDRDPMIEASQFHVYDAEPPKQKKKGGLGKFIAVGLCCAILGGAVGGGGVWAINHFGGSSTTIYEGTRPTAVSLANVDGKTVLSAEEVYASNLESVVGVNNVTTNVWGQTVKNAVSGSGFVISSNATESYILTNYHVIDGVSDITVFFADGKSYDATLVGGEEENDIAVLQIDQGNLRPVVLGDSDAISVGENVYAIGNPLGELTFTFTGGYVSAKDRSVTMSDGTVMNMIQTDTAINRVRQAVLQLQFRGLGGGSGLRHSHQRRKGHGHLHHGARLRHRQAQRGHSDERRGRLRPAVRRTRRGRGPGYPGRFLRPEGRPSGGRHHHRRGGHRRLLQ